MKNLLLAVSIVFRIMLIILLVGCSKDGPQFNIAGEWKAEGWECVNVNHCPVSIEPAPTMLFEIRSISLEGVLDISVGKRDNLPLWIVEKAEFVDKTLYIKWKEGYEFIGRLTGDRFKGRIIYTHGRYVTVIGDLITHITWHEDSYIWNRKIEITKR